MKKLLSVIILCLFVFASSISEAALTKSTETHDEWAEIAQNAIREGAEENISDCYSSSLTVYCAISSETAHTGTKIFVQVSGNTTGDEDWFNLKSFTTTSATANSESLGGAEAAGQTVLEVASTTGYDADGVIPIFIEDNIVANSEVLWLVSHVGNTSVTVQDGTSQAHDASDTLFNVVNTYVIPIPIDYYRVRVLYDNTWDSDGATVHTYSRISKVTGL